MYIPLIWQFESDAKKGEGDKVVKKNVISTFSSVAKFFFILKGIIEELQKIYNLTISTSRSNKNSSIKFNTCSYVMPIFPSPRFYSSLTLSLSLIPSPLWFLLPWRHDSWSHKRVCGMILFTTYFQRFCSFCDFNISYVNLSL